MCSEPAKATCVYEQAAGMRILAIMIKLLSPRERRRGGVVLLLILIMALLDIVGVASIMPFLAVLANPDIVQSNPILAELYAWLGFTDTESFLVFLGAAVFIILVGSLGFKAVATYAQLRFTLMREYTIGKRLVETYLHQPYAWFINQNSADLAKNVLSEVNQIINQAMMPMMTLISQGVSAIAIMILLILVDPVLTLVAAAVLSLSYSAVFLAAYRFLSRIGQERMEANQARFTTVNEATGAIKEVKLRGLEQVYAERFGHWAEIHARHQASNQIISMVPRFALETITFGGMLLVVLHLMKDDGSFSQALPIIGLYAFAGYRLLPSLQQIYASVSQLRYITPALNALHESLDQLEPKAQDDDVGEPPLPLTQSIRLEDIGYAYPKASRAAISGLNAEFCYQKTYGLVGPSGSGKSTAVDVILALLEPQSGQLTVDGELITAKNRQAWQRSVGYVPQQIYLSDDTIRANVALGQAPEQIDQAAVERAAKIANIHKFVTAQLPEGYNTKVGERGILLSGGQRQRIGIARALYRMPQVLVLDEATSALDNLTEQAVMDAVHNLGHDITIILVAHRLTTVRGCDQIFVIDAGRITAQGSYDELLEKDETFRLMAAGGTHEPWHAGSDSPPMTNITQTKLGGSR